MDDGDIDRRKNQRPSLAFPMAQRRHTCVARWAMRMAGHLGPRGGEMMPLCPLGARLTAHQPELVFADADDFLVLGSHARQTPRPVVVTAAVLRRLSGHPVTQPYQRWLGATPSSR